MANIFMLGAWEKVCCINKTKVKSQVSGAKVFAHLSFPFEYIKSYII